MSATSAQSAYAAVLFARYFVTSSSILLLLGIMTVFALAPALGMPLSFDQSFQVVKQIAPVFIGYLGQCVYFIVRGTKKKASLELEQANLLYLLAVSPFVIFALVFFAVIAAFLISNSASAVPGTGMSYPRFTDWVAMLLGLFTATISVLTTWLFKDGGP